MIADDFQAAFKDCDVIAGPWRPPWPGSWRQGRPGGRLPGRHLHPARSLAGLPGMSVPAGFGEGGMPVGLQLIGNYFKRRAC
jgi:aspartyl-tRNA(Asn)/glutamyl-tRNA(Gln) amidotransferase subunit A